MTAPEPWPSVEVPRMLRDAVRYTSVALMVGVDPDDPEALLVHEVRKCAPDSPGWLPDAQLAATLREFADRLDARGK